MICKEYLLSTPLLKLKVINLLLQLPRTLEPDNASGSQHHVLAGGRIPAPKFLISFVLKPAAGLFYNETHRRCFFKRF